MEKITLHIENLLCYHEYVVVPGLGGFVLQKQSAKITDNTIVAPRVCISFNALLQHADGLLAIEMARAEGVTYRVANGYIDSWVADIKSLLQHEALVALGNLGQLSLGESAQIVFHPNENNDFLPHNFGMHNIALIQSNTLPTSAPHKTMYRPKFIKYAAAAVLVFSMLFVTPQLNDSRRVEQADLLSFVTQPNNVSQTNADAVYDTLDLEPDTALQTIEPSMPEVVETVELPRFHVIVASLPTLAGAELACQGLKNESYTSASVISAGKHNRVAIASFCDRSEAVQYMETLRNENQRFETAWVYCE